MAKKHRIAAGLAALALGVGGALVVASPAAALGCVVSSPGNGAVDGTLVNAIMLANAGSCPTGITFSIAGTVPAVAEALPAITGDVDIFGPGEASLTIQGTGTVFFVNAGGSLALSDLTVEADVAGINATGAGVSVELTGVTVQGATADGIHVENGTFNGFDVRAVNNTGNGISFLGIDAADSFELVESDSGLNGADGLDLQTAGSQVTIDDLFVELNGSHGVDARVTGGDFDGTDIVASSTTNLDGIEVFAGGDADVRLYGGHSVESGGFGYRLRVLEASIRADGIAAFDNEDGGIRTQAYGADSFIGIMNADSYQNAFDGFLIDAQEQSEIEVLSSHSYLNGDADAGNSGHGLNIYALDSTVTIQDTEADQNEATNGGGITLFADSSQIDISGSHLHHNLAYREDVTFSGHGGGLYVDGLADDDAELSVRNTIIENNTAAVAGGGVKIQEIGNDDDGTGFVEFVRSTIRGNEVLDTEDGYGGGFALVDFYAHDDGSPVLRIDSSTISGNTAVYNPGFYAYKSTNTEGTGTVEIINSTISGNTGQLGAGIFFGRGPNGTFATLLLEHSTVANNTDPEDDEGGVFITEVLLDLKHTIIAGNGRDLVRAEAGVVAEWSIVENPDELDDLDDPADHNRTGIDPKLGPLANNGGPTETHFLLAGSPAIDTGNPAIFNPPEFDQRGDARIVRIIDIGAVEVPETLPATGGEVSPLVPLGALLVLLAGAVLVVTRRRAA